MRIPRYIQKILFAVLLGAALVMAGVLWAPAPASPSAAAGGEDSAPTKAPDVAPTERATLLVANDADGSLLVQARSLPLPADPGARARVILGELLDLYAAPDAAHPVKVEVRKALRRCVLCFPYMGRRTVQGTRWPW